MNSKTYGQHFLHQSNFAPKKIPDSAYHPFVFYNPLSLSKKININAEVPQDFATCKYGFFVNRN
ncbi:MAG: hypothetical protein ABI359_06210 [Ginsengibacter sp.]